MLKDITIGQFYPTNSIIHRLDPRVKLFGTILYIVTLFLAKKPVAERVNTGKAIVEIISFGGIFSFYLYQDIEGAGKIYSKRS